MEHLNDTLKHLSQDESRLLLKQFYTGLYDLDVYHTSGAIYVWEYILEHRIIFDKAIDVGCGSGNGIQMSRLVGKKTVGMDIAKTAVKEWNKRNITQYCLCADILSIPFPNSTFDFVVCNDVLEHIPEFDINKALSELRRIGSDKYFLSIAIDEECKPALNQIYAHITVRPREWWIEKFIENKFEIAAEVISGEEANVNHVCVLAVKDKMPYVRRERKLVYS